MSDAFSSVLGDKRGRVRRKPRRRQPGEPRTLGGIARDCLLRPTDAAVVVTLVAELRECWGTSLSVDADEPLGRLAVASLRAGLVSEVAPKRKGRAAGGPTKSELVAARRLALAHVRVLGAELAGDRAELGEQTLRTSGRAKGMLSGDALTRHRRELAADHALIAASA